MREGLPKTVEGDDNLLNIKKHNKKDQLVK